MLRGLVFALVCLFGCSQPDIYALQGGAGSNGNGQPVGPGAGGGGGGGGGAGGGAACATNVVPLELTFIDGFVDSQVVPIVYEGVEGWLAIDTGSWETFVFGSDGDPQYIEHVGDAALGCEIIPLALMTLPAISGETFQGKPILGILGLDFFNQRPTEIDYPARRVVRYVTDAPETSELTGVASAYVGDRVVVECELDLQPLHLMYDAGSPHTLWVGVEGEPGDEEITLGTADGGTQLVFEGTASLGLGSDPAREVTVWRTPAFDYLQEELDQLGADGLLGASGLGFRRILFDSESATTWLGPIEAP